MSAYDLEEQEQLAALKAWWKENGRTVIAGVVAAALAIAAWNGWNWYQRSQAAQAAALYDALAKAARANDLKAVNDAAGAIIAGYPRTVYAPLAALVSARAHVQAGDLKTARLQLQWAVEHARDDALRAVARLRLARVLLDQGAPDQALAALGDKPAPGFEALYESLRGDIFTAQKKFAEARTAYRAALHAASPADGALRESLRLKLDALGSG